MERLLVAVVGGFLKERFFLERDVGVAFEFSHREGAYLVSRGFEGDAAAAKGFKAVSSFEGVGFSSIGQRDGGFGRDAELDRTGACAWRGAFFGTDDSTGFVAGPYTDVTASVLFGATALAFLLEGFVDLAVAVVVDLVASFGLWEGLADTRAKSTTLTGLYASLAGAFAESFGGACVAGAAFAFFTSGCSGQWYGLLWRGGLLGRTTDSGEKIGGIR